MQTSSRFCLGLTCALLGCGGSDTPAPSGPSFFVAAKVQGEVHPGDVAMDPAGRFFVVWGDDREGPPRLRARLYAANGQPLTDEITVSSSSYESEYASVRMSPDGQSIVAFSAGNGWESYDSRVRRFDANGQPMGDDLVVFEDSVRPDVEILADGGFVVTDTVRELNRANGDERLTVRVRRFDKDAKPVGSELGLEAFPRSQMIDAQNPRVQPAANGGFTVLWDTQSETGTDPLFGSSYLGVFRAEFNAAGKTSELQSLSIVPPPDIPELRSQQNHFVNLPDRTSALLTRGYAGVPNSNEPRQRAGLQFLSPAGVPLGPALELHSRPEEADILPQDLALLGCDAPSGCLLMATWISVPVARPEQAIVYARLFDTSGRPRANPLAPDAAEFVLGTVSKYRAYPYVGGNARGDLVLVWRKTGDVVHPEIEQIDGFLYPGFADDVLP